MGDRSPLVLLPGLLNDGALWDHQVQELVDIAAPWVCPVTEADTMHGLAAGVLAAAPPSFCLAALSMGGYVALEILRQAPGRVRRLALLDTSARPDTPEQTERRMALIALTRDGRFGEVMPRLLPLLISPARRADRMLTAGVVGMAERIGPAAFIRQQIAIMNRPDSRPGLAAIACPTLVLGGRDDALTPPEVMAEIATGIPGASHLVIDDCGHLAPLERPDVVTRALRDWLSA